MKCAVVLVLLAIAAYVLRHGLPWDDDRIGLPWVDGDYDDAG